MTGGKKVFIFFAIYALVIIVAVLIVSNTDKTPIKEAKSLITDTIDSPKRTEHKDSINNPSHTTETQNTAKKAPSDNYNQDHKYLKQYSGEYEIKVFGFKSTDSEILVLDIDGSCTWIWRVNGIEQSKKIGSWTAKKGFIHTNVKGNSGYVPEDFHLRNGKFISEDSNTRYLIKSK